MAQVIFLLFLKKINTKKKNNNSIKIDNLIILNLLEICTAHEFELLDIFTKKYTLTSLKCMYDNLIPSRYKKKNNVKH